MKRHLWKAYFEFSVADATPKRDFAFVLTEQRSVDEVENVLSEKLDNSGVKLTCLQSANWMGRVINP